MSGHVSTGKLAMMHGVTRFGAYYKMKNHEQVKRDNLGNLWLPKEVAQQIKFRRKNGSEFSKW